MTKVPAQIGLFVALFVFVSSFTLVGQQITGSLSGIVMDASEAAIPVASIVMTNDASGDIRRTQTNTEGFFNITGVMPGTYTVRIEAPGFNIYEVQQIAFTAGDRRTLGRVTLDIATTAEEVTVTAVISELTPVESGEKSVVLTAQQFDDVSVVGRSAAEYLKILPGIANIPDGIENRPAFNGETIGINGNGDAGNQSMIGNVSANGTRANALDITQDGAHTSDPGCNCATPVNPNPEMIAEFKVQQSNFSAEYAKGPVVVNSITRSGGKEYHGSGYFQARHFALNSNDANFNRNGQERPENEYFFPGGTFGGPVLFPGTDFNRGRDKMFFFVGYEYFRQKIDSGLLRSVVPTQAMKNGDFSDTAMLEALGRASGRVADPIDSEQFPGGIIPASQLDPGMQALNALLPEPNRDPNVTDGFNWVSALTPDQNMHQFVSRVDYSINDFTKLFVRYNLQRETQQFPIQLWWRNAGAVPLPSPILGKNESDSVSFNFTKVINPTMTNETVFGYTFVNFPNQYEDIDKLQRSTVGFPYQGIFAQDPKIPAFRSSAAPTGQMWLTGGFDDVLFATKHLVTLTNNTTKVFGTHTLKIGGYFGWVINSQPGNGPSPGAIFFNNNHDLSTGNILGDMVLGAVEQYQEETLAIVRNMGWQEYAGFIQDNWKVRPNFTLELGVRLQHIQPWTARNEFGIATWSESSYQSNINAPADDLPGVLWTARDSNIPLSGWDTRALHVAPRIGFAWDLFSNARTVLRGGFGSFVYHDPQLAAGGMDLPAGLRSTSFSGGLMLPQIDQIDSLGDVRFGGTAVDVLDDRQPTTYNWNVTLSQRLADRTLWEISYVGNKSENLTLQGNLRDINQVPQGAMIDSPTANDNDFRPRDQFNAINVESHQAYSNYHSLQTTLNKQAGILNFTLAYTFSKALGILNNPYNSLFRDDNYGILPFNRPHIFSSSYVIDVPDLVKSGNAFARGVANGWQVSGIVQYQSGANLQQNIGGTNFSMRALLPNGDRLVNEHVTGTPAIRAMPILTCDPSENLAENQFVNGACFAPPIPGGNGQLGANGTFSFPLLTGPGFFNADLSVFKNFKVAENKNLEFRASAFNFLNRPNRSFVGGDPNLRLEFDEAGNLINDRFGFADFFVGKRIISLGVKFTF